MKKTTIVFGLLISTLTFAQFRGNEGGGGMPPAPDFAVITKQGVFVDLICRISAAGVIKISIDPADGTKEVEKSKIKFSEEIEDLNVARQAATTLGSRISREEGPTDAPVIEAKVVDENGEEHIIYSRVSGKIIKDKSPNSTSLMNFLKTNCTGIL